jgi:hypothetical protein
MFGFQPRQSTGVHSRLHVRALVLDNGDDQLALVSLETLHLHSFEEIETRLGRDAVALFLQGCAGDTGTQGFRNSRTIPEAERLGRKLADDVLGIVPHIDVAPWVRLGGASRRITLPQKALDPTTPPTIPPILEGSGIADEIQGLVIGDALLLAVGSMEAYVEIGLSIKQASPFEHTFVLAYSNGPWLGYLPSPHGYAVNDPDARTTPFAPEAPHVLVDEAVRLANERSSMVKGR